MNSRDSSSQSTAAPAASANRETTSSSGAEDDPMLSVTAALAKDAFLHFQSRRFSECLDVLHQLKQKKEDDPKVLHNIAIAEYFRDGCSDPKKLLEVLKKVQKKREELACASGEQGEAFSNVGNKNSSGSKGRGSMVHQFSSGSSATLVYMDEFDPTVATLNIAVIWFHLHEYTKALAVLEPLYHKIEPIDETTALHVCLLSLDVALACQDASKAADVLAYLEKGYGVGCVNQVDSASTAQQQSANLVAKSSSVPSSSSASDADLTGGNALESSFSRTLSLSEEPLDYESMFSSLDISGQNQTRTAGVSSTNDLLRTSGSTPTIDLKLYKVRFLLLTRNLKQAKREVKLAMNIARGRDSSVALLLKSQLEYACGNHRKAIKLLMASSNNQTQVGVSSMLNNLGCIYYQLEKYNTSSVLFTKALSVSSSLQKEKPMKLSIFSQDKSLLIIYNCGVQHMACGKPLLAAQCFQKASLVFYNRPMLWLRLAECCLMALEKGLIEVGRSPDKAEILVRVIGDGKWRHLAVENGISRNGNIDPVEKEALISGNDGQPKLSMSLARQCLLNALHLLDCSEPNHLRFGSSNFPSEEIASSEAGVLKGNHKNLAGIVDSKSLSTGSVGLGQVNVNGDAKEQKGGTSQEIMQNSISFYENLRRRENHLMKQALLANLAYVELQLENPEKALSAAKSLLELPECSKIYVFLGHVYAVEALCLSNRPKEGAEHLSIYLSGGNKIELPFSQEDSEQLRVVRTFDYEEVNAGSVAAKNFMPQESQGIVFLKPEEARGTLCANFATMYALEGELEQAHHFITQALSLIPHSAEATLTGVYVDLMLGKSQSAIAKLKQCSRVRFLPRDVQLNKL